MKKIQETTAAADIQAIQKFVVEQAFKGRIILNIGECGPAIGMTPQSARNLYTDKKFPFPTFPLNGVRKVKVSDIIVVMGRIEVEPAQSEFPVKPALTETKCKRRRGRPISEQRDSSKATCIKTAARRIVVGELEDQEGGSA